MISALRRLLAHLWTRLALLALVVVSAGCGDTLQALDPSPTQTLAPTFTVTSTSSSTPSPAATSTVTGTNTPTEAPTATRTETATMTPTQEPTSTPLPAETVTSPALQSARIPILMYHHITVAPPGSDAVGVDLSVPPDVFSAEIKFLHDQGFHAIHLTDLIDHFEHQSPLPPRPIIITFDDGYDDNYLNAFPTLKDYGYVGTFFIISKFADTAAPGYMNWQQVEEMGANGMEIGSHSLDHRFNLGDMPASVQWAEIKPSFDAVRQHLPDQAPLFAYPSGSYNSTTISFLKQLGYVAAVTTRQGTTQYGQAPLELRRIRIRGEWSIDEFAYWLNYWLGGI